MTRLDRQFQLEPVDRQTERQTWIDGCPNNWRLLIGDLSIGEPPIGDAPTGDTHLLAMVLISTYIKKVLVGDGHLETMTTTLTKTMAT